MRFLCQSDFKKFEVYLRDLHKRMILNAVANLQTPTSKKGLKHQKKGCYDGSNSTDFGWEETKVMVELGGHEVISSINPLLN